MIRKQHKRRRSSALWRRCTTFLALKQIHASMVIRGFNSDHSALRELVFGAAIAVSGGLPYALRLLRHIHHPDLFIFNTLIRSSAQGPHPSAAFRLFSSMQLSQIPPDLFTFPFLLKASTRLSSLPSALQIHAQSLRRGLASDAFVRNGLINFHANCGDLAAASALFHGPARLDVVAWSSLVAGYARRGDIAVARKMFDEMPDKDLVSWNVMISVYTKRGDMASARLLFDALHTKDVVSWNAIIAGYAMQGARDEAMEVFEEMQHVGERPDAVTLLMLLATCADSGALEIGQRIHHCLIQSGFCDTSIVLGNALIDMYAKCGNIGKAMEVFRGMREKDVSTWNSMIGGFASHGRGEESVQLFVEMRRERVRPNEITFVNVLVGCSHGGIVEEGRRFFDLMMDEYGIVPNIKHYGCMVDILGRAGRLKEAFEFMEGMRIQPNAIVWRTLLGACQVHGNMELAEAANKRLLEMRRDQSGDYVLMSNLYASMGEWDGVQKVRKLMDDSRVRKEAGCSVIDAENNQEILDLLDSESGKLMTSINSVNSKCSIESRENNQEILNLLDSESVKLMTATNSVDSMCSIESRERWPLVAPVHSFSG